MTSVLCDGAGGYELLAHDEWGAFFPLKKGILYAQGMGWNHCGLGQTSYNLVHDQRLFAASSQARGPVSGQTGGTHQSVLG